MTQRGAKSCSPSSPKSLYANYFEVGHTAFEFVLDFGQKYAGGHATCHTRIVTSPTYARALLQTLTECVTEYRRSFGEAE
jgi:hypothetical protein